MIRQLPGGGLAVFGGGVVSARGLADLEDGLTTAYADGIMQRGRAAGYGRHVRFEHGTVRELAPAAASRTVRQVTPAPDPREIEGTFLSELFLAELAAAKRRGAR